MFKISHGDSRYQKIWQNAEITLDKLRQLLSTPKRTPETFAQFTAMKKGERDNIKDVGGFVGGWLKDGKRGSGTVLCRSMLALDIDHASNFDSWDKISWLYDCKAFMYTTHSHGGATARYRVIIPLSRDVSADEYSAICRVVGHELVGSADLDPCSFEPSRLMYLPSCSSDGEFIFNETNSEDLMNPDEYLPKDWKTAGIQANAREVKEINSKLKQQADPLTKSGIVGAFCRAYFPIQTALDTFCTDVYEPCEDGRYHYIPADSGKGVVIYDDKFMYSWHSSDPNCNKLLNAYDLVCCVRFGGDTKAMNDWALEDKGVKSLMDKEREKQVAEDFKVLKGEVENWVETLETDKHGDIESCFLNLLKILANDPNLKGIVYNQLAGAIEIVSKVPWREDIGFWRDSDYAQIKGYIESTYKVRFKNEDRIDGIIKITDDRAYHPIKLYLESLPPWDNTHRVDTLLIDYLGAERSDYSKAVIRRALCAAVYRVYNPGQKFDDITILCGEQGLGKSTLLAKLGKEWFVDSISLEDTRDKTAAEKIQGHWIVEFSELSGMRNADTEKLKGFISSCDDKFRASYGRTVESHKRQCVFFGTTNDINFLHDKTGNRRFLPVHISGGFKKAWEMTNEEVDQIWAEVMTLVAAKEPLTLSEELTEYARTLQREAMEVDDRSGMVQAYLDRLLPENWEDMSLDERRQFLSDDSMYENVPLTYRRNDVCCMEIWCECFGRAKADCKKRDSLDIAGIMAGFADWEKGVTENGSGKTKRTKIYGKSKIYERVVERPF